jgi:tetratricopeptide (TPR) repeat protein
LDKLTRKELKTDKFAVELGHSLEFVSSHRRQSLIYGGAALAVILVAAGAYYFTKSRQAERQAALAEALRIHEGVVGPSSGPDDPRITFGSKEDKDKAVAKAFQDLANNHAGSNEAGVAHYHLASHASDKGNLEEAARHYQLAAAAGDDDIASSSNYSLALVYAAQGKNTEAGKLLRELILSPSRLVSKEQATLELARLLGKTKPDDARKLLEPLQKDKNPVTARHATAVMGELPAK